MDFLQLVQARQSDRSYDKAASGGAGKVGTDT